MDTDKKIKLFMLGMSKHLKKLPFVISFKINEDDVRKMFENNSEKWFWDFNIDIVLYLGESTEGWIHQIFSLARNLGVHLGLENVVIPSINTQFIVRGE